MFWNRDWRRQTIGWRSQSAVVWRHTGGVDEGPNLLTGPLAPDDEAAYDRLSAAADETRAALVYEAP